MYSEKSTTMSEHFNQRMNACSDREGSLFLIFRTKTTIRSGMSSVRRCSRARCFPGWIFPSARKWQPAVRLPTRPLWN